MNWQNILQAIFSAPSIILNQIVTGVKEFFAEEKNLVQNGEFDEEADIMESQTEQEQTPN